MIHLALRNYVVLILLLILIVTISVSSGSEIISHESQTAIKSYNYTQDKSRGGYYFKNSNNLICYQLLIDGRIFQGEGANIDEAYREAIRAYLKSYGRLLFPEVTFNDVMNKIQNLRFSTSGKKVLQLLSNEKEEAKKCVYFGNCGGDGGLITFSADSQMAIKKIYETKYPEYAIAKDLSRELCKNDPNRPNYYDENCNIVPYNLPISIKALAIAGSALDLLTSAGGAVAVAHGVASYDPIGRPIEPANIKLNQKIKEGAQIDTIKQSTNIVHYKSKEPDIKLQISISIPSEILTKMRGVVDEMFPSLPQDVKDGILVGHLKQIAKSGKLSDIAPQSTKSDSSTKSLDKITEGDPNLTEALSKIFYDQRTTIYHDASGETRYFAWDKNYGVIVFGDIGKQVVETAQSDPTGFTIVEGSRGITILNNADLLNKVLTHEALHGIQSKGVHASSPQLQFETDLISYTENFLVDRISLWAKSLNIPASQVMELTVIPDYLMIIILKEYRAYRATGSFSSTIGESVWGSVEEHFKQEQKRNPEISQATGISDVKDFKSMRQWFGKWLFMDEFEIREGLGGKLIDGLRKQ